MRTCLHLQEPQQQQQQQQQTLIPITRRREPKQQRVAFNPPSAEFGKRRGGARPGGRSAQQRSFYGPGKHGGAVRSPFTAC